MYTDPNCPSNNPDPTDSHDANGEYHKLESESVGPDAGTLIGQHLAQLADCAAAGTLTPCSTDPGPPAGTVIQPGRFNPIGTWIGIYFLTTGITGLEQLGLQTWVSNVFYGGVLVIAVTIATLLRRRTT